MPWALFYPADYSIGASNLGIHYIFSALRESGVAVERFFLAPAPYRSVDNDTLLERFSVVTAGVSYEGDVERFFRWLAGAGIPLSPLERERRGFPMIGAGGALTYINPLPLAAVCDFIVLGEGLEVLPGVVSSLCSHLHDGDRERAWRALAENPSVLVPPLHFTEGELNTGRRTAVSQPLDGGHPACGCWVTPRSCFGDTLLIELQRGCARQCCYCTLPACFGKLRQRRLADLQAELAEVLDKVPCEQIGLVTPEAGDYAELDALLDFIESRGRGVSFASLRIDRVTEKMLAALTRGGRKSLTVAPEAATDALRFSCGKKFSNELIMQKLAMAREKGVEQAKLYFMVGLPGESDGDVAAIADMCSEIIKETGLSVVVSAGAFVPKPGTGWQAESFIGAAEITRRYRILEKGLRAVKKKSPAARLASPKESEQEYLLTWSGYGAGLEMSANIELGKKFMLKHSNRAKILLELERLR